MTLRHPERLGPDGDSESDTWSESQDDPHPQAHPGAIIQFGLPLPRPSVSNAATIRKQPSIEEASVIHPFATDFGPKSLTQYLRSEIEKLRVSPRLGTGKGKQRSHEQESVLVSHSSKENDGRVSVPADNTWTLSCSRASRPSRRKQASIPDESEPSSLNASVHLSDLSNPRDDACHQRSLLSSSSATATRRSLRLARKDVISQDSSPGQYLSYAA